jgi:drug/metabolite transporter (DMT)-like permease
LSHTHANRRGIAALVVGMAAFTVNDALVKFVGRQYPAGEVIFVRGVLAVVLISAALIARGHLPRMRVAASGPVLLRSAFDALASALFIAALVHMPLAELSAVALVSPLLLTAMAVVFHKETVGPRRWAAIATGFLGTLLVVKPTPAAFDAWALVGLAAAFGSAARDLTTRRIDPGTPTMVISFSAAVAVTLAGLGLNLAEEWRAIAARDLALLAVAACFLGVGTYLMVLAFRHVDISVVAPFRYVLLLWAAIAGYVAFGEIPDRWAISGAAVIVASGLYVLHRDAVRRRERAA